MGPRCVVPSAWRVKTDPVAQLPSLLGTRGQAFWMGANLRQGVWRSRDSVHFRRLRSRDSVPKVPALRSDCYDAFVRVAHRHAVAEAQTQPRADLAHRGGSLGVWSAAVFKGLRDAGPAPDSRLRHRAPRRRAQRASAPRERARRPRVPRGGAPPSRSARPCGAGPATTARPRPRPAATSAAPPRWSAPRATAGCASGGRPGSACGGSSGGGVGRSVAQAPASASQSSRACGRARHHATRRSRSRAPARHLKVRLRRVKWRAGSMCGSELWEAHFGVAFCATPPSLDLPRLRPPPGVGPPPTRRAQGARAPTAPYAPAMSGGYPVAPTVAARRSPKLMVRQVRPTGAAPRPAGAPRARQRSGAPCLKRSLMFGCGGLARALESRTGQTRCRQFLSPGEIRLIRLCATFAACNPSEVVCVPNC